MASSTIKNSTPKTESSSYLAKFFGNGQDAINYSVILVLIMLTIAIINFAFFKQYEALEKIIPIFTLVFGYILGNNKKP